MTTTLLRLTARAGAALTTRAGGAGPRRRPGERGDVPGWVLITLMTALIAAALYAVARPQLVALFQRALNAATGIQ